MKNTFGNSISLSIFGESHGGSIGAVIDGLAPGIAVNKKNISDKLSKRRPSDTYESERHEEDVFVIESGVYNGFTTGTPVCIRISNTDTRSEDYDSLRGIARPGHCDYPAYLKYHGFEDPRGGGHFSGRLTAALVAAGSILEDALAQKGILIATHLAKCAGISDRSFDFGNINNDITVLQSKTFPALCDKAEAEMKDNIRTAKDRGDSVGGVLETVLTGVPGGCGEPWFDSIESMISHAVFSIPAVKGIEFGSGFALSDSVGSVANDRYTIDESGSIITETNNCGGICGGITNGMPILFRTAVKPTPSISLKQNTVNFIKHENTDIKINGRHDSCIAPRGASVVNAVTALVIADILTTKFGTDYLTDMQREG